MMIIIFEYFKKELGNYEQDQFECIEGYHEFKNYISDNDILNYEILDIKLEV